MSPPSVGVLQILMPKACSAHNSFGLTFVRGEPSDPAHLSAPVNICSYDLLERLGDRDYKVSPQREYG